MAEEIDVVKTGSVPDLGTPELSRSPVRRAPMFTPKNRKSPVVFALQIIVPLLIGAAILYYFFGPKKNDDSKKRDKSVPVTVAIAQSLAVPIEIRTTGNVQAYSVVNVLPQVGGQLVKVCFTQGDFVKKGNLLFEIDPRTYQAAYDQAVGNIAKDQAQIKLAQATMEKDQAQVGSYRANLTKDLAQLKFSKVEQARYANLVGQGAVSNEQSDQMSTNESSADATVKSDQETIRNGQAVVDGDVAQIATARGALEVDQAAARNAAISLGWCEIRSPMDGRTSTLNVYQGNVVTANSTQTPLVTIAQVHPIYISFTVPEEYLGSVRRCLNNGTLKVKALIEGIRTDTVLGNASFLEYTVNTTSGTALLRATFTNDDNRLYPGQFVDVIVTMPPDGPSIVVPANAVQTTQQGNSVYVVQSDNTVNLVRIDLKRTYGDWAAIGQGISAGDKVVTDGQLSLTPGARVKVIADNASNSGGHHSGAAAGSVGSGTPMNSMSDQNNDGSGTPFAGNQGANPGVNSGNSLSSDQSQGVPSSDSSGSSTPASGSYGSSATPSPASGGFVSGASGNGMGSGGHHHHRALLDENHGAAPLGGGGLNTSPPGGSNSGAGSGN